MRILKRTILAPMAFIFGIASILVNSRFAVAKKLKGFSRNSECEQSFLFSQIFGKHFLQGRIECDEGIAQILIDIPCVGIYENAPRNLEYMLLNNQVKYRLIASEIGWDFLEITLPAESNSLLELLSEIIVALGIPKHAIFRMVFL